LPPLSLIRRSGRFSLRPRAAGQLGNVGRLQKMRFYMIANSYELTRFLASQISGVSATDPLTFAAVVTVIVLVALAACLLPARRAAAVDPLVALRYEWLCGALVEIGGGRSGPLESAWPRRRIRIGVPSLATDHGRLWGLLPSDGGLWPYSRGTLRSLIGGTEASATLRCVRREFSECRWSIYGEGLGQPWCV